jgi:DNA polymerase type B, organellar and viral
VIKTPASPASMRIHEDCPDLPTADEDTKSTFTLHATDFLMDVSAPVQEKAGGRGKKKIDEPYLIIGFDTEYKTLDDAVDLEDIEAGKAKYRVLSYQFHCISSTGQEWSGMGCPDYDERITLKDFLIFALGTGISSGQIACLPTEIHLVGHLTKADLPAFSDFKEIANGVSSVRKTFVSLGAPLKCEFNFKGEPDIALNVYLRDTILLTPGGVKSLGALGDLVNTPEIPLSPDKATTLYMKRNMDFVRRKHWPLFRKYAINDAVICAKYFRHIVELAKSAIGKKIFPLTLSSIGVELLLKSWKEELKVDSLSVLGREKVTEEKYNKKLRHYVEKTTKIPIEECYWSLDFVTGTYHGGRNEQFWFGPGYDAQWTDYDLSSAYPTAMALIGMPDWKKIRTSTELNDYTATTLGFACVDFKFPDTVRYPTLPIRTQNGLIFPLEGRSYCAAPEVAVARRLGAEITIRHGVVIPTDDNVRIFGDFIQGCLKERNKHLPKTLQNLFWKEISNSTYGKTAQGLRSKRVYNMREGDMKPLPESKITNPFFASFITSFVRAVLGEIINSLPEGVMVFSCTTDGFITDASDEQVQASQDGCLSGLFAEGRMLLTGKTDRPLVLEKKHEIRLPLGWRTRGQATLEAGLEKSDDSSYNVILAKAGLSISKDFETPIEQSNEISRLFFERTTESKITNTSLTGIREIVEDDADLEIETTKRLSMEFDWKRRPNAMGIHPTYNHVIFSTLPWHNVDDFIQIKEQWTVFNKKSPLCIKSPADYDLFARYAESVLMLPAGERKYLATKDPDIVRLRQAFCNLWKQGELGPFDPFGINSDGKHDLITIADDVAYYLDISGIPTSRADVENSIKRDFRPNSCPPTKRCLDLIESLRKGYPKLNPEVIFAKSSLMSSLNPSDPTKCQFVMRAANP